VTPRTAPTGGRPIRPRAGTLRRRCAVHRCPEAHLYVNDAFLAHHNKPARARLRGLVVNPAIPADLLRRLLSEWSSEVRYHLMARREWSDEQFEALAHHPDTEVRVRLAAAPHVTPEQRARLVEDPSLLVLGALADGPDLFALPVTPREPALPLWAYERLVARSPDLREVFAAARWLPPEVRDRLALPAPPAPAPPAETRLERQEAEALAGDESAWTRAGAAADPRLPADLVARLASDPSPQVRLAVSMRPELSEAERAAIDYRVDPEDRITPVDWARLTRDPERQRRCVHSAHVGLRRSVAVNPHLAPDLVAVLSADDDFAVRLLLCENHADVPAELVLTTFLEARTLSRGRLLGHPAFPHVGLARLADSPDPAARCLVTLDPQAPPELVERLSHDPHPGVRACAAADRRLSTGRVLELFDDPSTTERAAANPHLPVPVMERVLADAVTLVDERIEGTPRVFLGNWKPDQLPPDD
jgi:hypothetical protein